jgi:hypothetical protein
LDLVGCKINSDETKVEKNILQRKCNVASYNFQLPDTRICSSQLWIHMHKHHNFQMQNNRKEKGQTIALTYDQVKRIDGCCYKVKSQSGNGEYDILDTEIGLSCSCHDHIYRHVKCKHIHAVEFSISLCVMVMYLMESYLIFI